MSDRALVEALRSSQRVGMLGPRRVEDVIAHAQAFVHALEATRGTVLDLGSGGGVPGLAMARSRPDLDVVLVDRSSRRTDHLQRLVRSLRLEARVRVITADAAHLPRLLRSVDAVVARGFGSPRAVVSAAAPLLVDGGVLVVSEPPPHEGGRWGADLLADAGFELVPWDDRRVAVMRRVSRETMVLDSPGCTSQSVADDDLR